MAKDKLYTIQTACPQCGCSGATVLSEEEMKARYGDVPNVEMECSECMAHYEAQMRDVCPEWDAECRLKE